MNTNGVCPFTYLERGRAFFLPGKVMRYNLNFKEEDHY